MEFIRQMARESATGFKDIADELWDTLSASKKLPKNLKKYSNTAGKYAITAKALMMLNFPDKVNDLAYEFNRSNPEGPDGVDGFMESSIGEMFKEVIKFSSQNNMLALELQGHADISQTSTYDDLAGVLPMIDKMIKEMK